MTRSAKVGRFFCRRGDLVRIMARDAVETALAGAKTFAELHLLNLPYDMILPLVHTVVDCKEFDQG
jgi:hypothetical protein